MTKKITVKDIEEILGYQVNENLRKTINDFDLTYSELTKEERDNYLLNVFNILNDTIQTSGEHRHEEWNDGWLENYKLFKETEDINCLIPKYHGKYKYVRWKGDIIKPKTDFFDYKIHIIFVDAIIQYYLKDKKNIFEFGCGPAYHLIRYSEYDKNINLYGLDWAKSSQDIIKEIKEIANINIKGFNFDFFKPDYTIDIPENSGMYTVAALEQVGDKFEEFVNFIINKKFDVCVNIEPIDELLNNNKLIDKLSTMYFRKRNYLKEYLPYLEKLEKEGKIEILKKQRIFSGSYFIEGHSLIVWKPKK
jgi:hypothetical protein